MISDNMTFDLYTFSKNGIYAQTYNFHSHKKAASSLSVKTNGTIKSLPYVRQSV